jgi:hypothetical protein
MQIRFFFMAMISLCLAFHSNAQFYSFTKLSAPYQELVNPIPLTTEAWDDPDFIVPIGFPFKFFGLSYDSLISTADISFGAVFVMGNNPNKFPIFGDLTDFVDRGYLVDSSKSSISYQSSGAPGTQICKIQWKNVGFYGELNDDDISTDFTNFQIWLYEGSGAIEFRYGINSVTQPNVCYDGEDGPVISLIKFFNVDLEEISPQSQFLGGTTTSPLLVEGAFPVTLNGTPENGAVYRFYDATIGVTPQLFSDLNLLISPNPVQHQLRLSSLNGGLPQGRMRIYDTFGSLVQENQITNITDVSTFGSGIYTIELRLDDQVAIGRFVKI